RRAAATHHALLAPHGARRDDGCPGRLDDRPAARPPGALRAGGTGGRGRARGVPAPAAVLASRLGLPVVGAAAGGGGRARPGTDRCGAGGGEHPRYAEAMSLSRETIAALPKVLLHDHLDGGLRPATMIELADQVDHELPAAEPDALGEWFVAAADSGSLERYLETFEHTIAVMQTTDALARVAREAVVDLAADGVVYAELRYAPEQHLRRGLSLQQVVDAVHAGITEGKAEAARAGRSIEVGTLLSAMRQNDLADEIAALTLANRDRGAVGFDIAGPEDGFPPSRQRTAFQTLREANFPYKIGRASCRASVVT